MDVEGDKKSVSGSSHLSEKILDGDEMIRRHKEMLDQQDSSDDNF